MVRVVSTAYRHNGGREFGSTTIQRDSWDREKKRKPVVKKPPKKRGRRGKMMVLKGR